MSFTYPNLIFEYVLLGIPFLYLVLGFFRKLSKSVILLFLFPVTIFGYVFMPSFLGRQYMIPVNFIGILKVVFIGIAAVTFLRWTLLFILACLTKNETLTFPKRLLGGAVSFFHGCVLIFTFYWAMDYLTDFELPGTRSLAYQKIEKTGYTEKMRSFNPFYDFKGAKSVKFVLLCLRNQKHAEELADRRFIRKFYETKVMKRIVGDEDLQAQLGEKKWKDLALNPLLFQFFLDTEIFQLLTSGEFVSECRSVLPKNKVKEIEAKQGFFSGIQFKGIPAIKAEKNNKEFKPDTRITLVNGFSFEGVITQNDSSGVKLVLEEGTVFFNKEEIASICKISK